MKEQLFKIGAQLDANIYPVVKNGGVVMPSESAVIPSEMGKEKNHEQSRKRKSEARSRQGTTRWTWTPSGSRPSSETTSIIGSDLQAIYEAQLSAVEDAYPGTQVWRQKDGLWLLVESALLPNQGQKALFLICLPYSHSIRVRGWGYWGSFFMPPIWIGPRHTNFPDGSICAFEEKDGTWLPGDSIVALLDLYTLWVVRHLYLKEFCHWPGYQAVSYPYERIVELANDEFCGCNNSDKLYSECCKEKDLSRNQVRDAVHFILATGGRREPPKSISEFIRTRNSFPSIIDLSSQ